MRTTKPISTISFNTPDFLKLKLKELQRAKRISFWAFVVHKPEDDEGGKKQHCHVFVEPSKMIQTDDLKQELLEFDPHKPDKPLGCISWCSSKFDHWYLYAIHDRRYLASKSQARRFVYKHSDIVTSDDDDLLFRSQSIDLLALSPFSDILVAQEAGLNWSQYFSRGTVPIQQITQFEKAWNLLLMSRTERGDSSPHASGLVVDPETGEVIEDQS